MQKKTMGANGRRIAVGTVLAMVLATNLVISPSALAEPTSSEKQAEAQAALASLNSMQQALDEASADYGTALAEQQEAEANRDAAKSRIEDASSQISDLQERLGERAASMYRSGSITFLDVLLDSSSFTEFATNLSLLNSVNENDAEMIQQTKDLKAEVEKQEAEYAEQERVAAEKAEEAKRIQGEAAATVEAMQQTYDSLSAEAAELLEQEKAAQEAAEAASSQAVVDASAAQAAASGSSGDDGSTPSGESAAGGSGYSEPPYDASTGNAIVDRAYSAIGCWYEWGACGPDTFDCSGLVGFALTGGYSRIGTTYTFMTWPQVSDPQPGDICTSSYHCGIYIGNGQMIHAPQTGEQVKIGPVQGDMIIVRCPW